jgi:hypothetical protein
LLTEVASAYARDNGARIIEAYPVNKESPSYRFICFVESFICFVESFEFGFTLAGDMGAWRPIVQRKFD